VFGQDIVYVRPEDVGGKSLSLNREETHHLARVLRKRIGDRFGAIDGVGRAYLCELRAVEEAGATGKILEVLPDHGESSIALTLAIAPPKKSRYELILEKCTEIGVRCFLPLVTERTLSKENSLRPERIAGILLAAAKQSGRSRLPEYLPGQRFDVFLSKASAFEVKLLAHEGEGRPGLTSGALAGKSRAVVCIGPEGGFTVPEVTAAQAAGFEIVGLGPRRLRSETAAIASCSVLLCTQSS
jgi:16S rRNA (uracil1498-N3)-methyltransferase